MQYNAESLAGDAEIDPEPPDKPEPEHFPGSHPLSLEALVRRAHDGLGHPGRDRFLRILKNSKASQKVMDIAKNLKCSVCEKFKLPRPSRVGAPPREIGLNEVVGIDTFQLRVPFSNKTKYCLNVVDYGSHFQLVIPLTGHTAHETRAGYRLWLKIFGPPRKLLCDLGREFQKEFENLAESDGTELLPSSLETPEQRGLVERQGQLYTRRCSTRLWSRSNALTGPPGFRRSTWSASPRIDCFPEVAFHRRKGFLGTNNESQVA